MRSTREENTISSVHTKPSFWDVHVVEWSILTLTLRLSFGPMLHLRKDNLFRRSFLTDPQAPYPTAIEHAITNLQERLSAVKTTTLVVMAESDHGDSSVGTPLRTVTFSRSPETPRIGSLPIIEHCPELERNENDVRIDRRAFFLWRPICVASSGRM